MHVFKHGNTDTSNFIMLRPSEEFPLVRSTQVPGGMVGRGAEVYTGDAFQEQDTEAVQRKQE